MYQNHNNWPPKTLDINEYIETLMNNIGFENTKSEIRYKMYQELLQQVGNVICNTASLYVEPIEIDEALERFGESKNMWEFTQKIVSISPIAQIAILDELNRFYLKTLHSYEKLTKKV